MVRWAILFRGKKAKNNEDIPKFFQDLKGNFWVKLRIQLTKFILRNPNGNKMEIVTIA